MVQADPRFIENEIQIPGFSTLDYDVGNLFHDRLTEAKHLLLELLLARLPELINLALHVLDVRDFFVALLRFRCLCICSESGRVELAIQLVDFIEHLLVSIGSLVVFLLRGVRRVVELPFSLFGFVVLLQDAIHVDGADLRLRPCLDRGDKGEGKHGQAH